MTSQLEAELEQLNDLARPGQVSAEDLAEIRRTTGLTMPGRPRQGHLSMDTAISGSSTTPVLSFQTQCSSAQEPAD